MSVFSLCSSSAAWAASGQVIAFEPSPSIFPRLQRNMRRNAARVPARVVLEQLAVSDQNGRTRFFKGGATSTGRIARIPPNAAASDVFEVECITLDEMVWTRGFAKPDLVKIDVEYVEDRVLAGMSRILQEVRPTIVCEIHALDSGERVRAALEQANYRVHSIEQSVEWHSAADVTNGHICAIPFS